MLGAIEIGEGARVGSGSVVIRDVPAGATVVGIPGRIVTVKHRRPEPAHADLPDPVAEALHHLSLRVEQLEAASGKGKSKPAKTGGLDDDSHDEAFDGAVEGRRDWPKANGESRPKENTLRRKR